MADFVIVVPKPDELLSVEWAFGTRFDAPDDRTRSGVELFRREFPFGSVTFALLDKQTNTYSSILTGDVIAHEAPRLIFMVGTALGRPAVPIGSIVVSDGVVDISEKRYLDDGRSSYVLRSLPKSDGLTLDAKNFVARSFGSERAQAHIRAMARTPQALVKGGQVRCRAFVATHQPTVICEPVVSGNDYRMAAQTITDDEIWRSVPTARAYDMEAAGFALAAANNGLQWLVVRGISDHGRPATKSDFHRAVAAGIAARFLAEFLEYGLVRVARSPLMIERSLAVARLRDEAYRLDGRWAGAMAYPDNQGQLVIFAEEAEFTQEGLNVSGLVRSRRISGNSRHERLEYQATFSIAKHGFAGGYWSETIAAHKHFGVLMGRFLDESTVLAGTWHGTANADVRQGYFKWYNTHRDGARVLQGLDLEQVAGDLVRTFREHSLGCHVDSCWVAP